MPYDYSIPERETDPFALPDLEVFWINPHDELHKEAESVEAVLIGQEPGWYYWFCFPGCLPDSEPIGPFVSYKEALSDARGT